MRYVEQVIDAQAAKEGDGVSIYRSVGSNNLTELDPFLLLDEIKSDEVSDYIGGFPSHPHRGFETVTYMLEGQMQHKDSVGNEGVIGAGDIQWMTAGSGIIHSEMPKQKEGRLWGFQLWVNLPASEKMRAPRYQEINSQRIPEVSFGAQHSVVRVLAGEYIGEQGIKIEGVVKGITTDPLMLDIKIAQGDSLVLDLPKGHAAMAYVYEGSAEMGDDLASTLVYAQQLALFGDGDHANEDDTLIISNKHVASDSSQNMAGVLLMSAMPLNEPIVRAGPFVMNSRQELEQAFEDYRFGRLTQ